MASDSVLDERTLRELYLTNFEIAVTEGKSGAVMTSYNLVNGTYANENVHLVRDILRGEWGFDGAVITDWGGGNDFVEGVRAGCSLEMPGCGDDSAVQLLEAVRAGRIDEATVDARVDELMELVFRTRAKRGAGVCDFEENHRIAQRAAEESIVLLRNEHGILPLSRTARVAVVGDFAERPHFQGAGSSMVNAAMQERPIDLLPQSFANVVGYAQGFLRQDQPDEALAAQAEELAKQADVVLLYLGLTEGYETEGLDRTLLRIPDNQVALLDRLYRVNPHIVVVMTAGSAVEMPWLEQCEALVWTGLGGQAVAGAVLRVLTGEMNPNGKLAETFPLAYKETPVSRYYPGKEKTSEYREGIYVGYRYYETAGMPVRFPFGFGLSYTTFEYANLTVTEEAVEFDLINTGSRAGAEVAQLYVSLPGAKVFRPKLELKGFAKVSLEPGEMQRVRIALDDKALRYWNVATNSWEVEGGMYQLHIAASAEDIRLTGELPVAGTGATNPYEGKLLCCYERCELDDVPDAEFAALLGHPIPPHLWDTTAPLGMNDTVMQLCYAQNPLARLVWRILRKKKEDSIAAGKPDLNLLFIYNIPFRGIAKMMNGMVSMKMAESILTMVNGHFFWGLGGVIAGFVKRPALPKGDE